MDIVIDIDQRCSLWKGNSDISGVIEQVLAYLDIKEAEVSVVLADDNFVQGLNREYRGKDKPTNVLSFPQDPPMLGDIVLAFETIEREASEQNKDFAAHLTHLLVHGVLHLLGYDHEDDQEASEMEGLEIEILQKMGINNPYEDDTV